VDGGESVEVGREGDEVERAALVELVQRRVFVVALPPQRPQLRLQLRVRPHHLPARRVHQRLPLPRRATAGLRRGSVLHQADHAVLEHPHTRHDPRLIDRFLAILPRDPPQFLRGREREREYWLLLEMDGWMKPREGRSRGVYIERT
jgi:hypothetical protein